MSIAPGRRQSIRGAPAPHTMASELSRAHQPGACELDAVDLHVTSEAVPRSDSRMAAALQMPIAFRLPGAQLLHDHPFGISAIRAEGTYRRKYPTGDWMTSPQVYEEIYNPFTALSFVDFVAGGVEYSISMMVPRVCCVTAASCTTCSRCTMHRTGLFRGRPGCTHAHSPPRRADQCRALAARAGVQPAPACGR